jgi:hypothetical protein
MGLSPLSNSDPITLGNIGHSHLEVFFRALMGGADKEEAYKLIQPTGLTQEHLIALNLSKKFASEFRSEDGKPLLVEESVVVPISDEISMGLTADLVWQWRSGEVSIYDWKFTRRSWSQPKVDMHSQLPGYRYYLNRQFDFGISKCKYVFLNTNNPDNPWYKTIGPTIDDDECAEVAADQLRAAYRLQHLKNMPVADQRNYVARTLNGGNCEYCPFQVPCRFERKGMDASKTLAIMFTTENDYGYQH